MDRRPQLGDRLRHVPTGFTGVVVQETTTLLGKRRIVLRTERTMPDYDIYEYTFALDDDEPFEEVPHEA